VLPGRIGWWLKERQSGLVEPFRFPSLRAIMGALLKGR
jgi:hypothetical protein